MSSPCAECQWSTRCSWCREPSLPPLRLGDVIVGRDVDTGARRTGVVQEVILASGERSRYRVRNREGLEWVVFWVGD